MACLNPLVTLKTLLHVDGSEDDDTLLALMDVAEKEIIAYKYSNSANPAPESVDSEDEMTQIYAVIAGYNGIGLENQTVSIENGTHRTFHYSDMIDYIRGHVYPIVGVRP